MEGERGKRERERGRVRRGRERERKESEWEREKGSIIMFNLNSVTCIYTVGI